MKKNHKLPLSMVLSGGVLLLILLAALLAPLSPYDPIAVETVQKFLPPSAQHLLGTDNFGRDTFTRLLYGGRVSLLVGVVAALVNLVVGVLYGSSPLCSARCTASLVAPPASWWTAS